MIPVFLVIIFSLCIAVFVPLWSKTKATRYFHWRSENEVPKDDHFKVSFNVNNLDYSRLIGKPVVIEKPILAILPMLLFGVIVVCLFYLYISLGVVHIVLGMLLSYFLLIPLIFMFIHIGNYTGKIYVYQNGLIVKNCFKQRVIYYNQLDCIESDVELEVGSRPIGVGFVASYNLKKDGRIVSSLYLHNYKNLKDLETVFTENNPYVAYVTNSCSI